MGRMAALLVRPCNCLKETVVRGLRIRIPRDRFKTFATRGAEMQGGMGNGGFGRPQGGFQMPQRPQMSKPLFQNSSPPPSPQPPTQLPRAISDPSGAFGYPRQPPTFQRPPQGDPGSVFGLPRPAPSFDPYSQFAMGPRPSAREGNPGLLGAGQGQAQSAGTAWDGLSAMDNLTGSGALDFTFDPAKFGKDQQGMYFSAASLGQNRGMGPNMWLTDPNTGQVISGNPNGGGLAGGMGNVFGQGLTPGQKYKLNYAGGQGPFRISGNFR